MPQKKAVTHRSFLLRCWQERRAAPDQRPAWRFMLQDVSAAQQHYTFATFEQLVAFLDRDVLGSAAEASEEAHGSSE